MKHVSILVPERAVLASIDDPRHMFTAVNEFLVSAGKSPLFTVQLVGLSSEIQLHNNSFTVHADSLIKDVKKTDLIFIPALSGDLENALIINQKFIPWIVNQYQQGAEVVSLCVGAFLLASTGLLSGKKCSTHWRFANKFRTMFPDVELVDDKIITAENGLYSSGGANSYWNLLLYLVEKYTDHEMAVLAAKVFAIEIDRKSQSPFMIFNGQNGHNDELIKKVQAFIEENYQDKLTVDQLSERFAISRRSFERRFKKSTNNTIAEYIQRVKIESAKKSFENSRKNISEVMYDVGYNDTKAFRVLFKKITGISPVNYKNKYSKIAIMA